MPTSILVTSVTKGIIIGDEHPNSSILRVGKLENETGIIAIFDACRCNENNFIAIKFVYFFLIII